MSRFGSPPGASRIRFHPSAFSGCHTGGEVPLKRTHAVTGKVRDQVRRHIARHSRPRGIHPRRARTVSGAQECRQGVDKLLRGCGRPLTCHVSLGEPYPAPRRNAREDLRPLDGNVCLVARKAQPRRSTRSRKTSLRTFGAQPARLRNCSDSRPHVRVNGLQVGWAALAGELGHSLHASCRAVEDGMPRRRQRSRIICKRVLCRPFQ